MSVLRCAYNLPCEKSLNIDEVVCFNPISLLVVQSGHRLVDCFIKIQQDRLSYFPVQEEHNNDA